VQQKKRIHFPLSDYATLRRIMRAALIPAAVFAIASIALLGTLSLSADEIFDLNTTRQAP